jgi:hypothetical protein
MLNSIKQINLSKKKHKNNNYSIFMLPNFPKTSFLQTVDFSNLDLLKDFKVALQNKKPETSLNNLRLTFSSFVFKSFFLFTTLKRRINKKNIKFTSKILFLHRIFSRQQFFSCSFWKLKKGKLKTTALCFTSFVPKSRVNHTKNAKRTQCLIRFSVRRIKRKKAYLKGRFKFYFVSSCKPKLTKKQKRELYLASKKPKKVIL